MRQLSYRTNHRLRKGIKILLILAAALILLLVLAVVYLGRFVVYTRDGAYLDFGRNTAKEAETSPTRVSDPVLVEDVSIDYADENVNTDQAERISGYYIDFEMLQDPEAVLIALRELNGPCTVMIDLKSGSGSFYYSTGIDGAKQADVNIDTMNAIISYLKNHGFTMIARVKTFEDTNFALEHLSCGLAISGGALWMGKGCYWLDPGNEYVVSYLKQIARELAGKGFREIVFDDFYFPDSTKIVYSSDKSRTQLIADTAQDLLNFFASSNITISFGNPSTDFDFGGSSHVFISDVTGSGVNTTVTGFSQLDDVSNQLVFLTGSKDNRFDEYQVLRPLLSKLAGQ